MRTLADALFLRRYDQEFLIEMKGIADGAAAAGAKFSGRPIDLVDIVSLNAWTEVEFLDAALRATPKGTEGIRARDILPTRAPKPPPERCSSFIATGPATADGKIVFGHITMWSLQAAQHFNVWLDIKPAKGHRVLMQSYPGGIQSTTDYYMNDNGMLVSETTIGQTRFNGDGQTEASRIRKALQYGSSIDEVTEILKIANNGLYSNEWLIGDTKTNEIAMFELGTAKSRLWRSSRDEWFGNTPGFYWGCNNTKDLDVRLETIASLSDKPVNVVFRPSDRDLMWQELYAKHRGKIDAAFGFEAFTTPPLAAAHSLDAKFTTAELARELKSYALFGPPLGRTWEPSDYEQKRYGDEIKPLISNGWTLLEAAAPAVDRQERKRDGAVDLATSVNVPRGSLRARPVINFEPNVNASTTGPAWHGTLLPNAASDTWLAAAWAEYERVIGSESALRDRRDLQSQFDAATDRMNLAMFPFRTQLMRATRTLPGMSLAKLEVSHQSNAWYDLAAAKGVWLLAELRGILGEATFDSLMQAYSRDFAGKPADAAEFRARAERLGATGPHGESVAHLFETLTQGTALPELKLVGTQLSGEGSNWHVKGQIYQGKAAYTAMVEILVETAAGSVNQTVAIDAKGTDFDISTTAKPRRLIVDPRNQRLRKEGTIYSLQTFERDLEHTLIVCGTGPEAASHREAAELLQRRVATQWSNFSIPIRLDRNITEVELRSNHLLLVGRPAMNSVVDRFRKALPVQFEPHSFRVADQTYAHPSSATIFSAANPVNSAFSVVVFAGLDAESTRRIAHTSTSASEVLVWPANGSQQFLVLPATELTVDFDAGE
jgi:hypothetical protein